MPPLFDFISYETVYTNDRVAVIILNYKRYTNVRDIILPSLVKNHNVSTIIIAHGLRETVFGVDHVLEDEEIVRDGKVLHIGDFKANHIFCRWWRWNIIKRLKNQGLLNEEYIHSHDDDVIFDNASISSLIQAYKKGRGILLSGFPGRNLKNRKYVYDEVSGACIITLGRSIFTKIEIICNAVEKAEKLKIPIEILKQEYICMSFLTLDNIHDYKLMNHCSINCKFIDLPKNHDLYLHPEYLVRINTTVEYFFSNK
jgi:hypothetical protein